jgi:SagB-type dehydrogenase family enzyme
MSIMSSPPDVGEEIDLPLPELRGGMPLAEALAHRRSRREFTAHRPTPGQVAQLCWAAQGITEGEQGLRTAPSTGATYPIMLFVVEPTGVYPYDPSGHRLRRLVAGDVRARLRASAEDQPCVGEAPLCLVLAVEPAVVAAWYGRSRGWRYALPEAGHAAQNVLLQAAALDLAGVPVGAFDDRQVAHVLGLPPGLHTVYLLPIGVPSDS